MKAADRWVEPGTSQAYPFAYDAYRRLREAQDRRPPRHQLLGGQVEHHVWRRWRVAPSAPVDVLLTLRGDASPRLRRMVAAILASIRRGHAPDEAIRLVSRRFGLPQARTRAYLAGCVDFELRRLDAPRAAGDPALACPLGDWP